MNSKGILKDVVFLLVFVLVVSAAFFMPKQTENVAVAVNTTSLVHINQSSINASKINETIIKDKSNSTIDKSCINKTGCDVIQ